MAWRLYFNMEKVAIDLIKENLEQMTNENFPEMDFSNYDFFDKIDFIQIENNIKRGFLISTLICSLVEASINNILIKSVDNIDDRTFESSNENKIYILSVKHQFNYSEIKGHHLYKKFKDINKIRNELIHFKNNDIGQGQIVTSIPLRNIGKIRNLEDIFIKSELQKYFENALKLIKLFCNKCGLSMYQDCGILTCDGCCIDPPEFIM